MELTKIIDRLFEKLPSSILVAVSGVVIMLLGAFVGRLEIPSGPSEQRWVIVCTITGAVFFLSGFWKWFRESSTQKPDGKKSGREVIELVPSDSLAASYSLNFEKPPREQTVYLEKKGSGIGSTPDCGFEGSVRPIPGTGVWIMRRKVLSEAGAKAKNRREVYVYEAKSDPARGGWKTRIWFGMWEDETRAEFDVVAVVPDEATRLMFQHHWAYRERLLALEVEINQRAPQLGLKVPHIPIPATFEPRFLAQTSPIRVVVTKARQW
jgi:hypothetical protein